MSYQDQFNTYCVRLEKGNKQTTIDLVFGTIKKAVAYVQTDLVVPFEFKGGKAFITDDNFGSVVHTQKV
jgi:hypothetical protein